MGDRYRMDDDTVVDTTKATQSWDENCEWNGNNFISVATGSQWEHETLYRSAKGRYYLVSTSNYDGSRPVAQWVGRPTAALWLLANDHSIPPSHELAAEAARVSE